MPKKPRIVRLASLMSAVANVSQRPPQKIYSNMVQFVMKQHDAICDQLELEKPFCSLTKKIQAMADQHEIPKNHRGDRFLSHMIAGIDPLIVNYGLNLSGVRDKFDRAFVHQTLPIIPKAPVENISELRHTHKTEQDLLDTTAGLDTGKKHRFAHDYVTNVMPTLYAMNNHIGHRLWKQAQTVPHAPTANDWTEPHCYIATGIKTGENMMTLLNIFRGNPSPVNVMDYILSVRPPRPE
jgi:hypothetical protein